jgi:hypothetical protein
MAIIAIFAWKRKSRAPEFSLNRLAAALFLLACDRYASDRPEALGN